MEVIKEYIDYIKDKKKLSQNTISSYYIDIKKYTDYLYEEGTKLKDVVENDIIS
ncbi:MAG: site-specific integrase, partial [Romboutsia sp.]|uniref:site-specific integrase n=1 Tax=Romboutsia sp. TaxID=1965302 RepID=UPI003F35E453